MLSWTRIRETRTANFPLLMSSLRGALSKVEYVSYMSPVPAEVSNAVEFFGSVSFTCGTCIRAWTGAVAGNPAVVGGADDGLIWSDSIA